MKKLRMITKVIALMLAGSLLISSCASTTMIQSNPDGAKVYLNGESVGKTPYAHTDTKIVGSVNNIRLEKEGYEPFYTSFSRDEEVDVGAIIGGLFIWVPFLWTMKYKPTHTYEMIPATDHKQAAEKSFKAPVKIKSKVERIKELKQLLDDNAITKEEFEIEKKKILSEDD